MAETIRAHRLGVWVLLVFGIAAVCGASNVDSVKASGKLIVVTFPQPGSQFSRPGDGEYEGFDLDLMGTFAKTLGVELEVLSVAGYDELIPAILDGRADVVASSFTITEEREEVVDFSEGYFPVLAQVVVALGSDINSIEDLAGKTGSALPGSSQERQMTSIGGITLYSVSRSADHWNTIRSGKADFAIIDSTTVFRDAAKSRGTKVAFNLPGVESYGCAFPPGSDLREVFNKHLSLLRDTSYLYGLVRRHFGEEGIRLYDLATNVQEE